MLRFEQLKSACKGQAVDEVNRPGSVLTEDQSASLPASVRVRYDHFTEVPTCVHRDVHLCQPCPSPPTLRCSAGAMLPRPSGSREDAALNRVVTRVLVGTHTTTEAIVAEPLLNSHDDTERRS